MKKIASIGSTKPEQFLYTDFSTLHSSDNPKHSISRILNYIKNTLKIRHIVSFSVLDTKQMYYLEPAFFNTKFNVYSGQQLWAKITNIKQSKQKSTDNCDDQQNNVEKRIEVRGSERQIISFLTKIILILTKQKNECAQKKFYDKFAELKTVIQWLQDRLLQIQKLIRDKIKDNQLKIKQNIKLQSEKDYSKQQQNTKLILQHNKKLLEKTLEVKHSQQKKLLESMSNEKIKQSFHIYRPSFKLKQAKDLSLLVKLAPYKSEKKRPFECKSLQSSLSRTVQHGQQKLEEKIQNFKKFERQKLNNRHKIQLDHKLFRYQNESLGLLAKNEGRRDEQRKSQRKQIQKLIKENNKLTNQRLSSLRNSLKSYSTHNQSRQIRQIIRKHRNTIQFVNNIDEIGDTSGHSHVECHNPKIVNAVNRQYETVDSEGQTKWKWQQQKRRHQQSEKRYADLNIESKILRRIKNSETNNGVDNEQEYESAYNSGVKTGRKSLIDLYDDELNPVSSMHRHGY